MPRTIEIEDSITVGTLADTLMLPVSKIITELMKNGVMATVNERIDLDTAQIIVGELGLDVELKRREEAPVAVSKPGQSAADSSTAKVRPPVVAVMGHVDHGKTSLLDAIRGSQVTAKEAGGITQHISAYQVIHNNRPITLLDTPGHEAFAALREHGAQLTDLVIIVVAADDGVKPQTIEAIRFARKAGVKMIVAINKIDKTGDLNRVKQQLAEQELLVEEYGGDVVAIGVSAKTKEGLDQLLDMVLLVADIEELKAEFEAPGHGLIIEAHMEQGRGPVAEVLVMNGTLRSGDFLVAGATYAKVRNLEDTQNKPIKEAGPSTPVVITGFRTLPEFGDEFVVVPNEKDARNQASAFARGQQSHSGLAMNSSELIRLINRSNEMQELNVIVKADVQGSLTSVVNGLKALGTEEVSVRLVGSGVGPIGENDIHLASTSGAIIYGFNVPMANNIKHLALRDQVIVRLYSIIYELLDDAKEALSILLSPEIVETEHGRLVVKGVFKTTKTEVICGGEVTKGKLVVPSLAKVMRDDEVLAEVEVVALQRGPQSTKEVFEGDMCGVSFKTSSKLEVQEGDRLEFFTRESIARSLK